MSDDRVPTSLTGDYRSGRLYGPDLGDMSLDLPEGAGPHLGVQATTITTMEADHGDGQFVVVFLGKPTRPEFQGIGFYFAMDPNTARTVATAIIRCADALEPRQ